MKTLEEVLQGIGVTLKEREKSNPTSSAGSVMTDSPVPTKSLQAIEQQQPLVSTRTSSEGQLSPMPQKNSASLTNEQKLELLQFVSTCFNALDNYGKTPEQLKDTAKLFVMLLSKYDLATIRSGFMAYMERNSKMPTPADIINIIEPPSPKPDWAAYVAIRQKMRDGFTFVMPDQRRYVAWCEDYVTNKLKTYEEQQKAKQDIQDMETRIAIAGVSNEG